MESLETKKCTSCRDKMHADFGHGWAIEPHALLAITYCFLTVLDWAGTGLPDERAASGGHLRAALGGRQLKTRQWFHPAQAAKSRELGSK